MAKVTTSTIKKEKLVMVDEPVYTLELTEKEAKVIYNIAGQIYGSEIHSARKYTNHIFDALSKVLGDNQFYDPNFTYTHGTITFDNDPEFCKDED